MASARQGTLRGKKRIGKRPRSATELSWSAFTTRQVEAHLLMGDFDLDEKLVKGKRGGLGLLRELARALCRRGNYALTMLRHLDGGDLAMVGVDHREDANRLSRTLRARTAPRFGPWLSHRAFSVDAPAYRRISLALLAA
jgi:hypothetical protein